MALFVIGGKPTCSLFLHVVHVANYLETKLPNFKVHVIEKKTGEFEPWLESLNNENKWHHVRSPIVWKELSMRGGIPHYVGGAGEFWEYCYNYYGIQSIETQENLDKLLKDHLQYFSHHEKKVKEESQQVLKIGIIQPQGYMLLTFLPQLMQISELYDKGSLEIRLYDITLDFETAKEMTELILEDLETIAYKKSYRMFEAVEKIEDVVTECELLIILGDFTRKHGEHELDWLVRNMSSMHYLADAINSCAIRNMKIIVATQGPVCFNAAVLIDACPSIRIANIVALTSDKGLGPLKCAAEVSSVSLNNLGGPPVWGYVGVNQFIDLKSTVMYSDIYCPYQKAIKNKGGSTLPLGEIKPELRFLCYLLDDEDSIMSTSNKRQINIKKKLHRNLGYCEIRSLISLIKQWYSKEETGDIISLGIYSNGSFDIPAGLVFSQPAILEDQIWKPFSKFPVMSDTKKKICKLVEDAQRVNNMTFVSGLASVSSFKLSSLPDTINQGIK